MRFTVAACLAVLSFPAHAASLDVPSGTYVPDPTHMSITWKVSHLGFSVYTGMFDRAAIDATIELDAANVANSSLTASVDTDAVRTLHPIDLDPRGVDFNAELASDMFLNAEVQPEITFTSTNIEVTGDNSANITGDLTINGETHPLVLETTLNAAGEHPLAGAPALGITATGVIDRTQYGVTTLAGPIGEEVTIEIQGEFLLEQ